MEIGEKNIYVYFEIGIRELTTPGCKGPHPHVT